MIFYIILCLYHERVVMLSIVGLLILRVEAHEINDWCKELSIALLEELAYRLNRG